jgi:hypothetical protein
MSLVLYKRIKITAICSYYARSKLMLTCHFLLLIYSHLDLSFTRQYSKVSQAVFSGCILKFCKITMQVILCGFNR